MSMEVVKTMSKKNGTGQKNDHPLRSVVWSNAGLCSPLDLLVLIKSVMLLGSRRKCFSALHKVNWSTLCVDAAVDWLVIYSINILRLGLNGCGDSDAVFSLIFLLQNLRGPLTLFFDFNHIQWIRSSRVILLWLYYSLGLWYPRRDFWLQRSLYWRERSSGFKNICIDTWGLGTSSSD